MNMSNVPTSKLVEELAKRDGVETVCIQPYEKFVIEANGQKSEDEGPVVLLKIWD